MKFKRMFALLLLAMGLIVANAVEATGAAGQRGATGSAPDGNNVGDMLYWDGSQWQIIAAPVFTTKSLGIATLHYCKNAVAPTWRDNCVPPNSIIRRIGFKGPAGGKVFYVTNGGLHGLEVAPADQSSSAAWGCYVNNFYIPVPGAQGTAVGTGAANTAAIIAACSETYTAAKIADAYALNGYTDWFLPSKDELNLLSRAYLGVGGFTDDYYWSSTEDNSDDHRAWVQGFPSNGRGTIEKDRKSRVRVIRAF